jgi:cobalt-zinc-cadmium efflux system outer membrane protein
MRRSILVLGLVSTACGALRAQSATAWTRTAVIRAALASSPSLAAARADTSVAVAQLRLARSLPDPTLSASYTKDVPQFHITAEMPIDQIWLGGLRARAGESAATAARYRELYQVAAVELNADTLYTRALAGLARSQLSARTARDADSLRRMTEARRDAGDASDLDVDLATLAAGQSANAAAGDSVSAAATVLQLQSLVGITDSEPRLVLADSLHPPAVLPSASSPVAPLLIASSQAELDASNLSLTVQRRSRLGSPTIMAGVETGDPSGAEPGLLPTVGVTLPLPLFNRNRGQIAVATAERDRAKAELAQAELDSRVALAVARTTLAAAQVRLARDRGLVGGADRVAALSLTAYREGAVPIASVLEAERTAREVQTSYIDDVANVLIASATLRLLTLAPGPGTP